MEEVKEAVEEVRGPEYAYPDPTPERRKVKVPLAAIVLVIAVLLAAGWYFTQERQTAPEDVKPNLKGPAPGGFGRPAARAV